tara:strand:+ start:515 stop:1237 length:723 start_codon:yes stop_codon:yes gene_type:complete
MSKNYIVVENLTHRFGDFTALDSVSFSVNRGEVVAIIGPNGSGKTTLLEYLVGLRVSRSGAVSIGEKSPKDFRTSIGYVPQRFMFDRSLPITVEEFMSLESCAKSGHRCKNTYKALKEVGMHIYAKHKLGSLSGGQFQRVMIARALLHDKEVLVFDEPSAGIDVAGEQTIYDLVKKINEKKKCTCIIVSHDLHVVSSYVDTVICINKKMVCKGSPSKVITPKKIKALFGAATGLYRGNCR